MDRARLRLAQQAIKPCSQWMSSGFKPRTGPIPVGALPRGRRRLCGERRRGNDASGWLDAEDPGSQSVSDEVPEAMLYWFATIFVPGRGRVNRARVVTPAARAGAAATESTFVPVACETREWRLPFAPFR